MLPNLCCETVLLYSLIILIVPVFNNRSILCCFSDLFNLCLYIGNEHIKGNCGAGIQWRTGHILYTAVALRARL